MSFADIFLGFLAILFPPVAVWIKVGLCTGDSLINIGLCCLGYLPGLIHAWYIIARNPEGDYDEYAPVDGGERGDHCANHDLGRDQGSNNNRSYGTQSAQPQTQAPKGPAQPQRSVGGPAAASSSDGAAPPPSYTDVVRGDNKVQSAG